MKRVCVLVLLAMAAAGAGAQGSAPIVTRSHCYPVGSSPPEPVSGQQGRAVQVSSYACRIEAGPMAGAILSGSNVLEWNGPRATVLSGNGVARKAGSTAVLHVLEGGMTLQLTDGKVTGYESGGKGVVRLGTGDAAPLNGRTYTYVVRPTGAAEFVIESTYQ